MKQPKLKRCAVPSKNLPMHRHNTDDPQEGPSNLRGQRLSKRKKTKLSSSLTDVQLCQGEITEFQDTSEEPQEQPFRTMNDLTEDEKVVVQSLISLNNQEESGMVDKSIQVSSGDIVTTFASSITQEKHLNSLTGINSFELLNLLTNLLGKFYIDKKVHKLTVKDRIILVFMKLKMALKLNVLSFLFKISPSTCKTIFVEYITYLAHILKVGIHWPSVEECQKNMPLCFRDFKTV